MGLRQFLTLTSALFVLATADRAAMGQVPPTPAETKGVRGPELYVAQRSQDLGTMLEGDKITIRWTLENHGDANLEIDHASSSCGCAVVQLSEEEKVIPPGGTLALKAEFDSTGRRESQVKSVTVYSNAASEPQLHLEFKVKIEFLFEIEPTGMLNLRNVRRGEPAARTLDVFPGQGRKSLVLSGIELVDEGPFTLQAEPVEGRLGAGQRIRMTVLETAALGQFSAAVKIKLTVDGIERERTVPIRGEVVAELSWLPKVVDATRQNSRPGKRLTPVTITAAEKTPFEILGVSAGPLLDAVVEPGRNPSAKTEYSVVLTLREDAPPGPFAAMLRIRTSSLDQPVVEVPVFGMVSPAVEIDPPLVLLRGDGTPAGAIRRVKIQASSPSQVLEIMTLACDNPSVQARVDVEASSRYTHIRFVEVRLAGTPPAGRTQSFLRLTTGVPGAEKIEIPVTVESGAAGPR